jgi:hypothetical protein
MNMGECPYPGCFGILAFEVPKDTPSYSIVQCDDCERDVWYRFSRLDPQAWTREQFEAEHVIDEQTKTISKRREGAYEPRG